MIADAEVRRIARKSGVEPRIIDLDYVLGWALQSLALHPELKGRLVFKGGTCLRKCYFPEYRFSEDLDFTVTGPFDPSVFERTVREALRSGGERSGIDFAAQEPRLEILNDEYGSATTPLGMVSATYDAQDRLLTYGSTSYGYSAHGDLRWKAQGTDATRYVYDALGALKEVTLPDATVLRYTTDPQGRRVARAVNDSTTANWRYGTGDRIVFEERVGGDGVRMVFAEGILTPEYIEAGGDRYRPIADPVGSVRLVVRVSDGVVVQRLEYSAFGEVVTDTEPGLQPFGFAGGMYDPATGLVRFGARDYDPAIGRWTSKDPIGFAGGDTNLYLYVGASPVSHLDPTGTYCVPCGLALVAAAADIGLSLWDLLDLLGRLNDPCASAVDRLQAGALFGAGAFLPGGGYGRFGDIRRALRQVHERLGRLPRGPLGKFGNPQRGDQVKGYRLDPAHPGAPAGSPEAGPHINWWDYSLGKRGRGGHAGAIPIGER